MLVARHKEILKLVKSVGKVSVEDLTQRFKVTPQTIRKDLNDLCDKHMMMRVHGGAILSSRVENVDYSARQSIASEQKARIGKAAAGLLPDNASAFVNIGTTTEAVTLALTRHKGLMVITNNINVANVMCPFEANQVIVAGGVVRASDGGIVGEDAVDFINQFKVDFAIMGVSAIDAMALCSTTIIARSRSLRPSWRMPVTSFWWRTVPSMRERRLSGSVICPRSILLLPTDVRRRNSGRRSRRSI